MEFFDGRDELPRHTTRSFKVRAVDDIRGIVVHQTAGRDNPHGTARYHVNPNHVSSDGCPGLLYTFFIRQNGDIWWANDLNRETWSQGGHGSPVPGTKANKHFLSIVLGGDFSSEGYTGDDGHPTVHQLHALLCLTQHLTGARQDNDIPEELYKALPCAPESLWGHKQFGKPACPGATAQKVVDAARHHLAEEKWEWDTRDWQTALAACGYLASSDIDGAWGPKSKAALVKFQTEEGLSVDGFRGPLTRSRLEAVT
jgi:hypothetical protein